MFVNTRRVLTSPIQCETQRFSFLDLARGIIYLCVPIHGETRMCIIISHKILSRTQHGERIASRVIENGVFLDFGETQRVPRFLARLGCLARRSRMDARMDHNGGSRIENA